MPKLRVSAFSISADGYGAGPRQDLEHPLGVGGDTLHRWLYDTRTFQGMHGDAEGHDGVDGDFVRRSFENVGAWIMGRNMFGPVRGPWPDTSWRGWWGENPPYGTPVFVLTNHAREPLEMDGGTTFFFETGGIHAALERAQAASGMRDIRVGGGVNVVRQYLQAGLIDEIHLAVAPVILGEGEHLFQGIDLKQLGFGVSEHVPSAHVMHVVLSRI